MMRRAFFVTVIAVVAGVTASLAASAPMASVQVTAGLNVANVQWAGVSGSGARLELGATSQYGISLDVRAPNGSLDLRSLAPDTTYYYRLSSVGRPAVTGTFSTDAAGSAVTLKRSGSRVLLNGVPYLPLMAYAGMCNAPPDLVAGARSLGAPILDDQPLFSKTAGDYINSCRDPSLVTALAASLAGHAWYYSDTPAVRQALSSVPGAIQTDAGIERTLNASPIGRNCKQGEADPCWFDSLASAAADHPVVVTSVIYEGRAFPKVHNDIVNFEFWEGIAAGAVGVDYFARGQNASFAPASQSVVALAHLNALKLATLEPAIAGGARRVIRVSSADTVRARAWRFQGVTYVVAVNASRTPTAAKFKLVGGEEKQATVLWEGRHVRVSAHGFTDKFASLAVHIYQLN